MSETRSSMPPTLIPAAAEDLCLAYANTLSWRGMKAPAESLHRLADLIDWLPAPPGCRRRSPTQIPMRLPPRQSRFVRRSIVWFGALAAGERVGAEDLELLNGALAAAPPRIRLMPSGGLYLWAADRREWPIRALLAPVLWSAPDLLARAGHYRVRRCANSQCLWLFLDRSNAGTRRWCDMSACGNRAKSRRHYLKAKGS